MTDWRQFSISTKNKLIKLDLAFRIKKRRRFCTPCIRYMRKIITLEVFNHKNNIIIENWSSRIVDFCKIKVTNWPFRTRQVFKFITKLLREQIKLLTNHSTVISFCHRAGTDVFIHKLSNARCTVTTVVMPTTLSWTFFCSFLKSIFTLLSRRVHCQLASSSCQGCCTLGFLVHRYISFIVPPQCSVLQLLSWFTLGWLIHCWEPAGS